MCTAKAFTSLLLAVLVAAIVVAAGPAHSETVNCTPITSVPIIITAQGIYCLTGNLNTAITTGNAITINANSVVLDLNGFKLGGLAAGPGTQAKGIYLLNRQNITIKNGTVRGFHDGIVLADNGSSSGHVVEDIRADQNTVVGIFVAGAGGIVRNNQVVDTGGGTADGDNVSAFGIIVHGFGPRVLNNDVIRTVSQGTGIAYGIAFGASVTGGLAVNNRVTGADRGIHYFGTGKYRDNLTFDVTTPYSGGTNAGNNN